MKTVELRIPLTDEQASTLALFLTRIGLADFRNNAASTEEAHPDNMDSTSDSDARVRDVGVRPGGSKYARADPVAPMHLTRPERGSDPCPKPARNRAQGARGG